MGKLEKIRQNLVKLKENNQQEINSCKEQIIKLEKEEAEGRSELTLAQEAVNSKKYQEAKNKLALTNSAKEMYLNQLSNLENSILSEDKAEEIQNQILAVVRTESSQHFAKAQELVEQLQGLAEDSNTLMAEAKENLKVLRYDIMRKQDNPLEWRDPTEIKAVSFRDVYNNLSQYAVFDILLEGKNIVKE